MAKLRMLLIALIGLAPAAAMAHGPDEHPADPNLHVGNDYEECYIRFSSALTQDAFHRFAREFGSLGAFKLGSTPAPLGRRGVELGLQQISFTIDQYADAWNDTFEHPDSYHELGSDIEFPKVRLRVGVSDRLDLGAFWTKSPKANYGWLGIEAKYGLLRQSETTPIHLAVRGAYTKTLYVQDMDMHAFTIDVAAGRTFGNLLTPYVGVGGDQMYVRETSDAVALQDETPFVGRLIGGLELRFWHLALGAEAHLSDINSVELKVASVF